LVDERAAAADQLVLAPPSKNPRDSILAYRRDALVDERLDQSLHHKKVVTRGYLMAGPVGG
jgi:hypothetical protein